MATVEISSGGHSVRVIEDKTSAKDLIPLALDALTKASRIHGLPESVAFGFQANLNSQPAYDEFGPGQYGNRKQHKPVTAHTEGDQ